MSPGRFDEKAGQERSGLRAGAHLSRAASRITNCLINSKFNNVKFGHAQKVPGQIATFVRVLIVKSGQINNFSFK